jgi:hypothetical protein
METGGHSKLDNCLPDYTTLQHTLSVLLFVVVLLVSRTGLRAEADLPRNKCLLRGVHVSVTPSFRRELFPQ